MSKIEHQTRAIVWDTREFSVKDIKLGFTDVMFIPDLIEKGLNQMLVLNDVGVKLTKDEALSLIAKLQTAVELLGTDFIVHDSGNITVNDADYETLEDYHNGVEKD